MYPKLIVTLCMILIGLGFVYWDQSRTPETISTAMPAETSGTYVQHSDHAKVQNVTFKLLNNTSIKLHDIPDRAIALHFWATWCAPCLKEFPDLIALAKKHSENLTFIAVSIDKETKAIDLFLKKIGYSSYEDLPENFLIAHDPDKYIAHDLFQSVRYPETFMITADFRIDRKIIGETDWHSDIMDRYIKTLASP